MNLRRLKPVDNGIHGANISKIVYPDSSGEAIRTISVFVSVTEDVDDNDDDDEEHPEEGC